MKFNHFPDTDTLYIDLAERSSVDSDEVGPDIALDSSFRSNYGNYMKTKVVRIGNSRGIRIPAALLEAYELEDGDELEIDRRREGILLLVSRRERTLSYEDSYREMQAEAAERPEWAAWDSTTGDGIGD